MMRAVLTAVVAFAAVPASAEMNIVKVTSPGGITAWLVEEHSIPFVALEVGFEGGTVLDAPGKRGVGNLMMATIEEGAGDMDSQGFAAAQEALAASFQFQIYGDSAHVSAEFLTENRAASVDLLRTALIDTHFDDASVERVKGQILSIIASDATDPGTIANNAFDVAAWGKDHPYGTSDNGTVESVTALTRDDVVAAASATLVKDRMFVGVVGDITPQDLGPMLDHLLGDLPATGGTLPGQATYQLKPGVEVIDFDTPQSIALFGQQGLKLDDPDYFAAFILNEAVGGGNFASRLMDEVREKRGLTYGIGTSLLPMDYGELVMGQVASANDKMGETIKVVRDVWADVATNAITEQQLADTKTFLTGAYPLRFDGNGTIAGQLMGMQMNRFPIDYVKTRNQQIEAVTMDDIKRVAKRLYRPGDLHFTVVGRPVGVN
ncbi:MAG: pitrilysin family protein [Deltaproteobacteria bacterium]